jgi:hypothetical protein
MPWSNDHTCNLSCVKEDGFHHYNMAQPVQLKGLITSSFTRLLPMPPPRLCLKESLMVRRRGAAVCKVMSRFHVFWDQGAFICWCAANAPQLTGG